MNANATTSMAPDGLRGALLAGFVNVAEDGTLCFVSDRMHRTCPDCGTVFVGSAWRVALSGPQACPFCGLTGTVPLVGAGVA
jgi:predicted RNA-binding Zn-ribbon protein involved in translation (DUF1610 family)